MKSLRALSSISEAVSFANGCFHFQYEPAYVELCMEGNVFEQSRRHTMRYFSYINEAESFTSQRFKQLTLSDEITSNATPSNCASLLNTSCRIELNGSKCTNCDMQDTVNRGSHYVPLRPRSNDDHQCKLVALQLNMCALNHLGTRRIRLVGHKDMISLQRQTYGYCGVNCNLWHNMNSTLALLPLNLGMSVDDTVHWARQNYRKDHEANVCGPCCGCGGF